MLHRENRMALELHNGIHGADRKTKAYQKFLYYCPH